MNDSDYSHQLCVLNLSLWTFARQSISDWKNEYLPLCDNCAVPDRCGGFFASTTLRNSDHLRPLTVDEANSTVS